MVSLGAEPFVADVSDKEAMARAFSGAEAAYVMIPPDLANPDYAAYQDTVTEAIASALGKGAPGTSWFSAASARTSRAKPGRFPDYTG